MVQNDQTIPQQEPKTAATKRPRPEVQVVVCGAAFPISTKPPKPPRQPESSSVPSKEGGKYDRKRRKPNGDHNNRSEQAYNWHDTVKEVRSLGSTAFTGTQKRQHVDDQYKLLTGRDPKKQRVPLPIVRGLKKKAAARQARQWQEAKEAGIVLPTATVAAAAAKQQKKKKDSTNRVHGPAPSIGFVKQGVYRVSKEKKT
jgi:hypothetical protein